MLCASLLVLGLPLLTTTETVHSVCVALESMLYVCFYVQRLSAESNIEVRSYYLSLIFQLGTLQLLLMLIQARCAIVVLLIFRHLRCGPPPDRANNIALQS